MQEYKIVLGVLTIAIALVSYSFYFRDIFSGKTKPHAFSWFVWSVLAGIVFAAQLVENAGPGAWITGFTAVVCLAISILASFKATEQFKAFDWISLAAALAALVLWHLTKNPNLAVVLVSAANVFGFLPTFRKGYYKPQEETLTTFILNGTKFGISILALSSFSLATWLYPATVAVANGIFAALLIVRRRQIK